MKLKAEASAYPGWVQSTEDEERCVESFWKNEEIRLDKGSIKSNAAKWGLAKLCLNSTWGKLTERNDRTQTKVISEPKDLYKFLSTPGIEVTILAFASEDVVWISWTHAAEEHVPSLRHRSSRHHRARIHLYRYLDRPQEKAIYCDTDSVIYIQPRDEPKLIETGDRLGIMTYELRPTECVSEFVSGVPKNYSLKIIDTVTCRTDTVYEFTGITR